MSEFVYFNFNIYNQIIFVAEKSSGKYIRTRDLTKIRTYLMVLIILTN